MRNSLILTVIILCYSYSLIAQETIQYSEDYSIILPSDYPKEGKEYPLIVCYKNQSFDSLLQSFATKNQLIILQLNFPSDSAFESETKRIIINTRADYSIYRDKIFLIGINQNIRETVKLKRN
jgi:hypothetical protein